MNRLWVVLALAACPKPAPEPTLANRVRGTTACKKLEGFVIDGATNERAIGATVVLTGGIPGEEVVITDEHGAFSLPVTGERTKLTLYWMDQTIEMKHPLEHCGEQMQIRMPSAARPIY